MDKSLINVVQLGLGFMFIFTAFKSCGIVKQTVIKIAIDQSQNVTSQPDGLNSQSGYYSFAITYAVFTFGNLFAAPVVQFLGPRISMFVGAISYIFFIASFLKVKGYLLYSASVLVGLGAPLIWTGQGTYLTANSTPDTYRRNSGIVWALRQCSLLFGSLFLYFIFRKSHQIKQRTTFIIFISFTVLTILGTFLLFLLRPSPRELVEKSADQYAESAVPINNVQARTEAMADQKTTFCQNFTRTFTMLCRGYMLLLLVVFFFTGLEMSFFTGVYTTCVANTKHFGQDADSLIGLTGIFIGVGGVLGVSFGGLIFGIMGKHIKFGPPNPVTIFAMLLHCVAFLLISMNIPSSSAQGDTYALGLIAPRVELAVFCAFCLGLADACWNTQIYSILMALHPQKLESSCAFALFKFAQSLAASIAFSYSSQIALHSQLIILVSGNIIATVCFIVVEWRQRRIEQSIDN